MTASRMLIRQLRPSRRGALSTLLRDARKRRRWSIETLVEKAERSLRWYAMQPGGPFDEEERELWLEVEITRHHVYRLENCPARPLADMESRARLLGVTLALELDLLAVNRLAGGLG